MAGKIDFFNQVVIAKHGKPEGWRWHSLDAHNMPEDFVKVTGSVPVGVISRGPRKGSAKWAGPGESVFIRMADIRAAEANYDATIGLCYVCQGVQPEKPCQFCKGTGKK